MSENNSNGTANHLHTKIPIPSKLVFPTPIPKKPCNKNPPPLQETGNNRANSLMGPPRSLPRSTSLKRTKLSPSDMSSTRHSRSTSGGSHVVTKRSISATSSRDRPQPQRVVGPATGSQMHPLNQDKLVEQICERLKSSENFTTREEFDSLEKTLIDLKTERAQMQFERQKFQDNEKELQWRCRQLERDLEDEQRRRRIDNEDYTRSLNTKSDDIIREWNQKLDNQQQIHSREIQEVKMEVEQKLMQEYRVKIQEVEDRHSNEMETVNGKVKAEQERANQVIQEIEQQRASMVQERKQESDQWQDKLQKEIQTVRDDCESRISKCIAEYQHQLKEQLDTFQGIKRNMTVEKEEVEFRYKQQQNEITTMRNEIDDLNRQLSREKAINEDLCNTLSQQSASSLNLETSSRALRVKIDELMQEIKHEKRKAQEMEENALRAEKIKEEYGEKLQVEETLRRKLHNQIQDLKGNIRVYCRVRPPAEYEQAAEMTYPDAGLDSQMISVVGPTSESAMGQVTTRNHQFTFDRVFGPGDDNSSVYNEISQLIQSAMDGYNVCIFCYGQTGSGKSHTMTSPDGVIQRAVSQIYESISHLREKGWDYSMEGQFIEIYNETINDLLASPSSSSSSSSTAKYEIRHDAKQQRTTVSDVVCVKLTSPEIVERMLEKAASQRMVAATKANDKSSRSHSVFMLRIYGENATTGESCDGTLNLIDLAGSERLNHSQSSGERLKETQSINKSLSCLGDVICALDKQQHIPYRNSKLTYLLQYSLGGNSKTLMFVNISPDIHHISESINSLRFATKVNNTKIGNAKTKKKKDMNK